MTTSLEFETPENIRVAYQPAGLGTRYMAWLLDNILLTGLAAVIFIVLVVTGIVTDTAVRELGEGLRKANTPAERAEESQRIAMYITGILMLFWGFQSFVYYTCLELWMRGQTIGKRALGLRVIRIDGFALEPSSILIRNLFRVIDQMPPLWLVPLLSRRSQRLGDMVAGTTVIVDKPEQLSSIRQVLSELPVSEATFAFDAMTLKRGRPQDFEAIEQILNRWESLATPQQQALLDQIVPPLVERLKTNPPTLEERLIFLEDLLAAEYRRQHRNL